MTKKIIKELITISSGTTTGEILIPEGMYLSKVKMPASISSTAMYIQEANAAGGTYTRVQDGLGQYGAAGDVTFTIAASKTLSVPPAVTYGLAAIKLEFGASETSKTFTYTLSRVV